MERSNWPPNPFNPSSSGHDCIVGRKEELTTLDRALASGAQQAVIMGGRGVGKTTLARQFLRRAGTKAKGMLIDLRDHLSPTEVGRIDAVMAALVQGVAQTALFEGLGDDPRLGNDQLAPSDLRGWLLPYLVEAAKPGRLVICIDELDYLEVETTRRAWRGLVAAHNSPLFIGILGQHWARPVHPELEPFFNPDKFTRLRLAGLLRVSLDDLARGLDERGAFRIDEEALNTVHALTAGYPLLLSILLNELFEWRWENDDHSVASTSDVETARERFLVRTHDRLEHAFAYSGPDAQMLLRELADPEHRAMPVSTLKGLVRNICGASDKELDVLLGSLKSNGIITEASGVLRIASPLLEEWVGRQDRTRIQQAQQVTTVDALAHFRSGEDYERAADMSAAMSEYLETLRLDSTFQPARANAVRLLVDGLARTKADWERATELAVPLVQRKRRSSAAPVMNSESGVPPNIAQLWLKTLAGNARLLPDGEQRRALVSKLRQEDPQGSVDGVAALIGGLEVQEWREEISRVPNSSWADVTRRALRESRCWEGIAEHVRNAFRAAAEGGNSERGFAVNLLSFAFPALVVAAGPDQSVASLGAAGMDLIQWLDRGGHRSLLRTVTLSAWRALIVGCANSLTPSSGEIIESQVLERLLDALDARAGELAEDAFLLLRGAKLPNVTGRVSEILKAGLLDRWLDRSADIQKHWLEGLPAVIAGIADSSDEPKAASALVHELLEAVRAVGPERRWPLSKAAIDQWQGVFARLGIEPQALLSRVDATDEVAPATIRADRAELEAVEALFQSGQVVVKERIPFCLPGATTPMLEERVRLYRAVTAGKGEGASPGDSPPSDLDRLATEADHLVKVFHVPNDPPVLAQVIRRMWDLERRILAALSLQPEGRALLRFHSARQDPEKGDLVVALEWPGTWTLRDELDRGKFDIASPKNRGQLRSHLLALLESVRAVHGAGLIHRSLRPEAIYVVSSFEHSESELAPSLKLAHFENAAYVRSLFIGDPLFSRHLDRYVAPESLRSALRVGGGIAGETFSSDLYGLGLVLFETLVRRLSKAELGTYVGSDAYGPAGQEEHKAWLTQLKKQTQEARQREWVTTKELQAIVSLLEYDLSRRTGDLDSIIKDLSQEWSSTTVGSKMSGLVAFTTLHHAAGHVCIAHWLDGKMPGLPTTSQADETYAPGLAKAIESELEGARIYLNQAGNDFPLLLLARSGLLFRAKEFAWHEPMPRSYPAFAFLEVARPADRPRGPHIGRLGEKQPIKILPVRGNVVEEMLRQPPGESSWRDLFAVAGSRQYHSEVRRRDLTDALRMNAEVEYDLLQRAIEVKRVGEEGTTVAAVDPGVNLALELDVWSRDELTFVLGRRRFQPEISFALDPAMLNTDDRTMTLPASLGPIPATGWLRPESHHMLDALYRRRKRILTRLEDDTYLLDAIVDPVARTRRNFRYGHYNNVLAELDREKQEIARNVLSLGPLLVTQGPPGTGKTTLASEVILQKLKQDHDTRILITSHGHDAIDNLLERLQQECINNPIARKVLADVDWVRIPSGQNRDVAPAARPLLPHGRAESAWLSIKNWVNETPRPENEDAVRVLREEIRGIDSAPPSLIDRIIRSAQLVFATSNAAFIEHAANERFDFAIIEEAGRAYPIEIVAPMRLARSWLLIGDDMQLPAYGLRAMEKRLPEYLKRTMRVTEDGTIEFKRIREAFAEYKLLFQRLLRAGGGTSPHAAVLKTQWRMHPKIADMVSRVFYDGQAVKNPEGDDERALRERRTHPFFDPPWVRGRPIVWIDTSEGNGYQRELPGRGGGYENKVERHTIHGILQLLKARMRQSVAILSPYRAQVEELRAFLRDQEHRFPAFLNVANSVFTADSYQGRQCATVILSLVRDTPDGEDADSRTPGQALGFLDEKARSTVMCSRAESLLIVVGSRKHFEHHHASWILNVAGPDDVVNWLEIVPPTGRPPARAR